MTEIEIDELIKKQECFFENGHTLNVNVRIAHLKELKRCILKHEAQIYEALYKDLGKSRDEAYMCEIGLVLAEISFQLKHIKKYSKPRKKKTPLFQAIAKSYTIASPYGRVLVMSPWNYPFLLSLDPLLEAVAAGNTVVVKTSEYAPNTSMVVKRIVNEVFDPDYCEVIYGGYEENQLLINKKWDYVFFTGSKHVGNIVYQAQAKYMTPVTLELGGKSPVIIDESANLKMAARRIVWGKTINSGQTCVAPDHVYVHKSVHKKFVELLKVELRRQVPDALKNDRFCKMINEHHFNRALRLLNEDKCVYGGGYDSSSLKIEPTIIDNADFTDSCMKEEIFAPILPIIEYDDIQGVVENIKKGDAPLAFYVFSKKRKRISYLLNSVGFGGGCVNDVVMHLATCALGFGGFKESGIGSYHGKSGFSTFSHYKSIVDKATIVDMPMRYHPEYKLYNKVIKMFLK